MKLLLEMCVLGREGCLRQSIKYMMVLLFVKVKITLFYDPFAVCPLPWAGEQLLGPFSLGVMFIWGEVYG